MDEKEELLLKIKAVAKEEATKHGFMNEEAVTKAFDKRMEGLDLEKLKSFDGEATALTIKNIAAELEKLKNRKTEMPSRIDANVLKEMFQKSMEATPELSSFLSAKRKDSEIEIFSTKAAAIMTTQNTINENNYPLEMIESVNMIDEVVKKRRGYDFIFDVADRVVLSEIEKYTTWEEEGSEQGAFAVVAEGGLKPLVSTALVRNYATAKKVAGKMVITEEFAKWRKKAWAVIQQLLNDKLMRDYKALALADLITAAASYTGTSLDDTIVAPNDIDAIGAVAAQIQALDFTPDVLIINPADLWRIKLSKETTGGYLYLDIQGRTGESLLGYNVVVSTRQPVGTAILGESKLFKIEEENVTVRLGYGIEYTTSGGNVTSVSSDFDTNRLRLIMELFYKAYIPTAYTGSFVSFDFTTVKAALLKP